MSDRIQIRMSKTVQAVFDELTGPLSSYFEEHKRERANETVYNLPTDTEEDRAKLARLGHALLDAEAPEDGRTARALARITQQLLEGAGDVAPTSAPEPVAPVEIPETTEEEAIEAQEAMQAEFVSKLEAAGVANAIVVEAPQEVSLQPEPKSFSPPPESERAQAQLAALFYRLKDE